MPMANSVWHCLCDDDKDFPIEVKFRKPNRITPTIVKTVCTLCDSRFVLKYSADKENKPGVREGKTITRQCSWSIATMEMSPRLQKYLQDKKEREDAAQIPGGT